MIKPTFSVIIPCRSMCDFLRENILHLKNLKYKYFEVLIILDRKEDFDFEGDQRFKMLNSGPVSPGRKRNIGAKLAHGEFLVFLDDDAYPHPNWLNSALEILRDTGVYALGGPAVTPPNSPFLERMSGRVLESVLTSAGTKFRHMPCERRFVDDYPAVNLFVKRKLFLELNGFDEKFWPGEDTKLCLDMVKKEGGKFLYDPKPIVYHHRRPLFIPHLKQISRYGKYRGRFAKVFPETSRRFSYFVPSLFVLWLLLYPVFAPFLAFLWPLYISSLWFYTLILFLGGMRFIGEEKSLTAVLYFMQGVFLTHLVYGLNFIDGFIKNPRLELRNIDNETGNYLGG